jgi:hypothetical protein
MGSPKRAADRRMIAIALVVGTVVLGLIVWRVFDFLAGFHMD